MHALIAAIKLGKASSNRPKAIHLSILEVGLTMRSQGSEKLFQRRQRLISKPVVLRLVVRPIMAEQACQIVINGNPRAQAPIHR
jgi:hypothetical protein